MKYTEIQPGQCIKMKRSEYSGNWITIEVTRVSHRFETSTLFEGWRVVRGNTTSVIGKPNRHGEYNLAPKFYRADKHTLIEMVAGA